jgi:exopolysaccharide biosynthesis WecB/TagA/CpsF family protein/anti-anti-sigma factor
MLETTLINTPLERSPIAILGVPFDNVTAAEAVALIGRMVEFRQPHYGATVGVDFLVQSREDVELRRILFDAHLVLAGEKQIVRASKILGNELPEVVAIENLVPQLLTLAEKNGWRVFFLGGAMAETALTEKVRAKFPKLPIAGVYAPPEKPLLEMDHREILHRLREARPDILLIAFGFSKQEKWIAMNIREAAIPFALGVGMDWNSVSGTAPSSPRSGNGWKFNLALLKQWRRLRAKKTDGLAVAAKPAPDAFGNLIIRAPERLGAAEVQSAQAEWLQAVERGHVMFDLSDTVFSDSTGVGALIRLRKRARELSHQFFLISPRPPVAAALKLMKLDEFFNIQTGLNGAYILMENAAGAPAVISGVQQTELQIRWVGEVTALNATELGMHTESELSQASPGMTVVIDLSRVSFVDSTGIGLMVRFKKNLQRRGMILKFINPSVTVRNVLQYAQLEEFLLTEK